MMRKITHYLLLGTMWFSVVSCSNEEVATPPKATFQVSKTNAEIGEKLVFTINQVNAKNISLLPYGLPGGDEGIRLTNFTNGVATVEFAYAKDGTFQAIVVSNNHSGDGETVKNVHSEPITITITSSKNEITAFGFDKVETKTEIDQTARTINVTVPYGTDVTQLKATFTASTSAKVRVGGTEQKSGTTVNNFSSPVTYAVTAVNGDVRNYTVTVIVTPVETTTTIKSATGKAVSKSSKDKALPASVNNTAKAVVIYDTLGTPATQFDSVRVGYTLDGKFARLKYGGKVMKQDTLLDLTTAKEVQVFSQDSTNAGGIQTYKIYAVAAPKLALSFPGLTPDPAAGAKPQNFNITISVLKGTDVQSIVTNATVTSPSNVVTTVTSVNDAPFIPGGAIDYTEPVKFALTVNDGNIGVTYTVVYTVTVTVVP